MSGKGGNSMNRDQIYTNPVSLIMHVSTKFDINLKSGFPWNTHKQLYAVMKGQDMTKNTAFNLISGCDAMRCLETTRTDARTHIHLFLLSVGGGQ